MGRTVIRHFYGGVIKKKTDRLQSVPVTLGINVYRGIKSTRVLLKYNAKALLKRVN